MQKCRSLDTQYYLVYETLEIKHPCALKGLSYMIAKLDKFGPRHLLLPLEK